ncbi:hypothetical protein SAMN05421780_102399 [Flexibacter flexilis DSM 6793]|uniref:Uncharacterized protein n=1 Tax=Flexibacter flexilis DSM 6793 TaxID=927664 RepID=A0A1I1G0M9_9BACT|nr:hypothetical protein [Flexibacter flexilis]SFC05085.1 hypothetical protein SAMN05421780_102399 [Flexibacter flexilis DSM 6793]
MPRLATPFNRYTLPEYLAALDDYKQTKRDFNTLGFYRSILENEKLTLEEKQQVLAYAYPVIGKSFEFLVLKDPHTYYNISILGREQEPTIPEYRHIWQEIKAKQQAILEAKDFGHRSFGTYSKHDCGYEDCPYNGLMIQKGSVLSEGELHFCSDRDRTSAKKKSLAHKKDRKQEHRLIRRDEEL